jgi:hypothetical protein
MTEPGIEGCRRNRRLSLPLIVATGKSVLIRASLIAFRKDQSYGGWQRIKELSGHDSCGPLADIVAWILTNLHDQDGVSTTSRQQVVTHAA